MGSYISTEAHTQAADDSETKEMQDFLSELPSQHLEPLWSQMNVMVPPSPNPTAKAHMWKYAEALPQLQKAGALVPEERAERRVLMLVNPSMQSPYTTDTIYGGLQLVNPGETAPAHRHLAFACRFIIDGEGFTAVEGKKMPLVRGDVVTTPIWHWHDHGNESREPVIWLDMLNLPLFRFAPVHFAEGYADPRYPSTPCDPCEWRHPWAPVEEALNAAAGPHAVHHYRNADGRPLSTTLGVQAERLAPGAEAASRDSCSYIYHCYEGTGRTEVETPVGEKSVFRWTARDTFAVPAWSSVRHVNESPDQRAYLVACHDAFLSDAPKAIGRRTTSIYRQRDGSNANMAEIVGLVASSIALAQVVGKIGGGVLKLKRMWDEVKDVPEAIQDLFKRLELILPMVARIARDIETGATLFEDMEAVESCILSCQQVISDEATMMNDLIVQIDATKRARRVRDFVRVALKRDVLERHEKKLEVMIQILLPVHSEYSRACTKAIPTAVVQHLSASGYVAKQRRGEKNDVEERDLSLEPWRKQNGLSTYRGMSLPSSTLELPWKGQSFFGSFTSASRTSQIVHGSSKYDITERAFRLQPPRWLAQHAWELRVLSGWQLHFRAYNFVPDRSPAFISVVCGDMNTLLRLFKGGKASPFDVSESGSLMHEALRFGRLRIIRTLVQLGVCMSHQDLLHATYGLANMGVQSDSLCDIEKARHDDPYEITEL
ncbi:hypothetical protein VDGE_09609 [Verticillium dahliae]|uniref:Cupin type-2 domain-containing protein n=1 Tax=Verticillium dahliae TaxID=27337 RepID=A0A444RML1_VERDA|nr:hypothetical protein VDGE_09609 [Verticillium dahliae]